MSLVWTLGIAWNARYRSEFAEFLSTTIHQYYSGSSFIDKLMSSPACVLSKLPTKSENKSKKTIFDFCFDISLQKWVCWKDLKLEAQPCITPNFHSVALPIDEMLKFNPGLAKIPSLKTFKVEKEFNLKQTMYELGEAILVDTETVKSFKFFLDYLIAYRRPILVTSHYENGKSVVIRNKLKQLLEGNSFNHTNIAITPFTTQAQVKTSNL